MKRIANFKFLPASDKFAVILMLCLTLVFLVISIGLTTTTGLAIAHIDVFQWYVLLSIVVTLLSIGLTVFFAITGWSFMKLTGEDFTDDLWDIALAKAGVKKSTKDNEEDTSLNDIIVEEKDKE